MSLSRNLVLFALITFIFAAQNALAQGAEKGDGRISGTIIDSSTNQPVEFATVALMDPATNKPVDGTVVDGGELPRRSR